MSCSAWLWVTGTADACRKRSIDSRQSLSRNARLCPGRRFLRPRRFGRGLPTAARPRDRSTPPRPPVRSAARSAPRAKATACAATPLSDAPLGEVVAGIRRSVKVYSAGSRKGMGNGAPAYVHGVDGVGGGTGRQGDPTGRGGAGGENPNQVSERKKRKGTGAAEANASPGEFESVVPVAGGKRVAQPLGSASPALRNALPPTGLAAQGSWPTPHAESPPGPLPGLAAGPFRGLP